MLQVQSAYETECATIFELYSSISRQIERMGSTDVVLQKYIKLWIVLLWLLEQSEFYAQQILLWFYQLYMLSQCEL